MNNLNFIELGYKGFNNNKKKLISILFTTISAILVLICVSYSQVINNYWNNALKSLVDFRTYFVTYNNQLYNEKDAINKLRQYKHVSDVANSASYLITMIANEYVNGDMDGTIYLEGTSKDSIQTILGNNLSEYSDDENVIVCAKQFYPKIEANMSNYDKNKIIDISDKVGKNISLSFLGSPSKNETFKVVGLYDARKNYTEGNICYANFSTVNKLNRKYQYETFNDINAESPLIMVIDNINYKDQILQEIKDDGFHFENAMIDINTKNGNQISVITSIASIIMIMITIIINFIIIVKNIEDKKGYYSDMKSCGYTNSQIAKAQYIENLIIGLISFVVSLPLDILVIELIKKFYFSNKIMYLNINFSVTLLGLFLSLSVCILIPLISSFISNSKIKKLIQ